MREILFRGKRIDNGKWVYGAFVNARDVIDDQQKSYIIWEAEFFSHGEFACVEEVIPETVGQSTELCDKNGKKIFEGDCFLDADEEDLVFVVEFRQGQFCLVTYGVRGALMEYGWDETAGGFGECDCSPMSDYNIDTFEVNGNIHDNKNLLEEQL